MPMIKIVDPLGWDFDAPIVSPVRISSRGLIGSDRRAFVKRAGDAFLPFVQMAKEAKDDEEPVHIIALGAYEKYGGNRRGDAFSEKTCRKYHSTFEKSASFHRAHKNKPPDNPSYGYVKMAAYNDLMSRVELLVMLNKTKEAADRNSGRVADLELEKLASDGEFSTSMACLVGFDSCTYCGHSARTPKDYCTADICGAGGCRDNLTRVVKLGNDAYRLNVFNPEPVFFDISHVGRGADMISWATRADRGGKQAGDPIVVDSSEAIAILRRAAAR